MAEPSSNPVAVTETEPVTTPPATESPVLAPAEDDGDINLAEIGLEQPPEDPLAWQASEYIHHHKGARWYIGLAVIMGVLLLVAYIFQLWLSIGVFIAMALAIIVYAHRPPRVLSYKLSSDGVDIESKHYSYSTFRSFGVISDEDWHAIDLEPTQRFMPRLTLLFGDDQFDDIVDHLTLHLPRTDRRPDVVERLSRYLRF